VVEWLEQSNKVLAKTDQEAHSANGELVTSRGRRAKAKTLEPRSLGVDALSLVNQKFLGFSGQS